MRGELLLNLCWLQKQCRRLICSGRQV